MLPSIDGITPGELLGRSEETEVYALEGAPSRVLKVFRGARWVDLSSAFAQWQRVVHPNVVRLFERGDSDAGPWVILERVEGGSAAALLENCPREELPALDALAAFAQDLLGGLSALHSVGLLHETVTPRHLLIGKDGIGKVTDPGLRTPGRQGAPLEHGANASPSFAQAGPLDARQPHVGAATAAASLRAAPKRTAEFLAPEALAATARDLTRVRGGAAATSPMEAAADLPGAAPTSPPDVTRDLYGAAATLSMLATGVSLFAAPTETEATSAALAGRRAELLGPLLDLDERWGFALMRAFVDDPGQRFQSAEAFARAVPQPSESSRSAAANWVRGRLRNRQ